MKSLLFSALVIIVVSSAVFANSAPVVSNVSAAQRNNDSKLVDIYYNLADADGDTCTVWAVISDDGGASWQVPAITLTGNVGSGISPGNGKHIIWDAGKDVPGKVAAFKARVYADDGKGPADMVLVPAGHFAYQNNYSSQIFVNSFKIDKYEVTNDFYCQFLNNADPTSLYWNSSMEIDRLGTSGSYYYAVKTGKGQYPIRSVSALDAEAFAAWRSSVYGGTYHLPTEQQWEKAAGWNPASQHLYTYGFQQDSTIDCTWCNYNNCVGGTTAVGLYNGTGGKQDAKSYYGCYDMSGNVWEWTSSNYYAGDPGARVFRGGDWFSSATYCTVTYRYYGTPSDRYYYGGFRLVLDLN
jgi:formylglycine-generating enzyme required for sulfatase activity